LLQVSFFFGMRAVDAPGESRSSTFDVPFVYFMQQVWFFEMPAVDAPAENASCIFGVLFRLFHAAGFVFRDPGRLRTRRKLLLHFRRTPVYFMLQVSFFGIPAVDAPAEIAPAFSASTGLFHAAGFVFRDPGRRRTRRKLLLHFRRTRRPWR